MTVYSRVELNITYRCQLRCTNCNRLCNILKIDEDMTVDQIRLFLQKLKEENKHIVRIKVVGGEPTVHPNFMEICGLLSFAVKEKLIDKVVVNTNGVNKDYDTTKPIFPGVFWKVSKSTKKVHRPFLWSPKDMGLVGRGPCKMPRICGFSLDYRGWLPCSAAPAIVRVFGLEYLYRPLDGPLPPEIWGMGELCQNCIFGVNDEELKGRSFVSTPDEWKHGTISWQTLLEKYIREHPEQVIK